MYLMLEVGGAKEINSSVIGLFSNLSITSDLVLVDTEVIPKIICTSCLTLYSQR